MSFWRVNGMRFSCRAMRVMRAKGEGVAEMRVRGSGDMVGCSVSFVRGLWGAKLGAPRVWMESL